MSDWAKEEAENLHRLKPTVTGYEFRFAIEAALLAAHSRNRASDIAAAETRGMLKAAEIVDGIAKLWLDAIPPDQIKKGKYPSGYLACKEVYAAIRAAAEKAAPSDAAS